MKTKYMMNLKAIEAKNPEMADFLFGEVKILCYTGNHIPVVDITTGRIYGSLVLDKIACNAQITRRRVIEAITNGTPVKGTTYASAEDTLKDYYGNDVEGHYFMDCGSVDFSTLKSMWRAYKAKLEEGKEEDNKIKTIEAKLKEVDNLHKKADKLIEEIEELMKK